MTLDPRTLIIKTDNEEDLPGIMDLIKKKDKKKSVDSFLDFASKNRVEMVDYKFNRDSCYGR